MYCSTDTPKNKSQNVENWANLYPQNNHQSSEIWCGNKPVKIRDWRLSRDSHRNKAEYFSLCCQRVLNEVASTHQIFRGCIKFPNQNATEWKKFKDKFRRLLGRSKHKISIAAKQHITHQGTDFHFDYIGFSDGAITPVSELIRQAAKKSGGSATCVLMDENEIVACCNYAFKFALTTKDQQTFFKWFYLPSTEFSVTWMIGNFWRRKPIEATIKKKWNGELIEKVKTLSPQQQIWREHLEKIYGEDNIPEFTTKEYRTKQKVYKQFQDENVADQDCSDLMPLTVDDWKKTYRIHRGFTGDLLANRIYRNGEATENYLIEDRDLISDLVRTESHTAATRQCVIDEPINKSSNWQQELMVDGIISFQCPIKNRLDGSYRPNFRLIWHKEKLRAYDQQQQTIVDRRNKKKEQQRKAEWQRKFNATNNNK